MIVFTNGCFDVLHVGHFNLLVQARELAGTGQVFVAIDMDEKIMVDKHRAGPIFSVFERKKALEDLRYQGKPLVDQVFIFHTNTELHMLIKRLRPNLLIKGSDWEDKIVIGSDVASVKFIPRTDYSSSEVIKRCQEKNLQL